MRILAAADIHGKQFRMNKIVEAAKEHSPDLVVICGDITQFGPGDVARLLLDQIPVDTIAIPGNVDTEEVIEGIEHSKAVNLHRKKITRNGYTFIGIGGSNPLPFHTRIWFTEEQIEEELQKLIEKNCVLVTHVPPHGTQDKVFFGYHAGSKSLREFIDEYSPRLHLCGHIHEDAGYTMVGDTMVVNCTGAKRGSGALIDLNDDVQVRMLE